jgi:hypothetical protein
MIETIEEQIELLQNIYLTYQQSGASEQVLQMTLERLTELQELAK